MKKQHPQSIGFRQALAQQRLRDVYHAWLASPFPGDARGGLVAGSKTRNGIKQGIALFDKKMATWNDLDTAWTSGSGRVWVWSDHHLHHTNICRYAGRPFDNLMRMHEVMAQNAQHVGSDDFLVFGGDLSFGSQDDTKAWLRHIPGRKVLILGNHDVDRQKNQYIEKLGFEAITDCLALVRREQLVWMTHYPIGANLIPNSCVNVHGHIHQKSLPGELANMSVEHTDYAPVLLEDLLARPRIKLG